MTEITESATTWTKKLVQEHAQAAAAVELYTLPFYITAMTSVVDKKSEAYKIIFSVVLEEMLHLQLAANICTALDTSPGFSPPQYGKDVPYIKPYDQETGERGFLNATLGPLEDESLNTMLDIENPEELPEDQMVDHRTPQCPYNSIGEMYDGLILGIKQVGIEQFSWNTTCQQAHWTAQNFPQIIASYADARNAVQAVTNQGEGHILAEMIKSPPWTEQNFPVPPFYRLLNEPKDPEPYNGFAHFGRFLKIKNSALPEVYPGIDDPLHPIHKPLQQNFFQLLIMLETLWVNGGVHVGGRDVLWTAIDKTMKKLLIHSRASWKAGIIPSWFEPALLMES